MEPYIVVICESDLWLVYRLNDNNDLMAGVQHIATLSSVENVFIYEFVYDYTILVMIDDSSI